MSRPLKVAAAQMGPIARNESRVQVVDRMLAMMRDAHRQGIGLLVYPEMALTTFFPRWYMTDQAEIDAFFETEMPGPQTRRLFDLAATLKIGFYLGYAEKIVEGGRVHRFNTSILVDPQARIVGKYRKVHLPGHAEHEPQRPWQHLEKRYFEVGNLGLPVWRTMGGIMGMCICNDRRWPETFRVMGLQGVEVAMLGYNTPAENGVAPEGARLRMFHSHLTMQAGAYQNGTYVIGTAKGGVEEGVPMLAGSCIIDPNGEIVAQARTEGDELVAADIDLDRCQFNKRTVFNFDAHRRIEHYGLITARTGAIPPTE